MLHAVTFDDILRRAPAWGTPADPLGQRLISIVFARPSSAVWRDLESNRAFLDLRSGDAWDLFFAGMSAFAQEERDAEPIEDPSWHGGYARYLNPDAFREIEDEVYRGQESNGVPAPQRWRYSGYTDLVSFMCYARKPDWASLRYMMIEEPMSGRSVGLGRITEGLKGWMDDDLDPDFAPGVQASLGPGSHAMPFDRALAWAASAVAGGVMGNSAYDLLRILGKG